MSEDTVEKLQKLIADYEKLLRGTGHTKKSETLSTLIRLAKDELVRFEARNFSGQ